MKARLKHNNEIINVIQVGTKTHLYDIENVEFLDTPDYWEKLLHQYAGMAMQGIMANSLFVPYDSKEIANISNDIATALIEKLKNE